MLSSGVLAPDSRFKGGALLYLFFTTSVGVFLATIAKTMPQLGLLYLLVAVGSALTSVAGNCVSGAEEIFSSIGAASPPCLVSLIA